ncbi:hypothetical protein M422DRAFT_26647 [Sphaerobolus stellatus SS14]|nr:hypothetical protein M422DRAFT_26647 [Sphaerobolus stellatus SS14]
MRSLPTRREIVFVAALLATCFLFFRLTTDATETIAEDTSSWSNRPQWFRGNSPSPNTPKPESKFRVSDNRPLRVPQPEDGARDSQLVSFGDGQLPTTDIIVHVPGWTVFENLYLFNGTIYIVTNEPQNIPDRMLLTSSGAWIFNEPKDVAERTPTDADMQIITPEKAKEVFGSYAAWLDGTSFISTDPDQFVHHYYHWCAELFFGLWRTYSLLDPSIDEEGHTDLPAPRRIMFSHVASDQFRDYASITQWFTQAVFPAVSLEFEQEWVDRSAMTRPFLLERVVLGDRAAAMHTPMFQLTQRTNAELFKLAGSPYWWSTIRNSFVQFAGHDPSAKSRAVITYISRQTWPRRKLIDADHDTLVAALEKLSEEHGYELNIVSMENLSREEQIRLAGRTTIMMGVHGNGLTSLLWMKPSNKATVIEFFYPGGFAQDYEWTTRALGMKHYGVWGNQYFTAPDLPPIAYPEGFQGNEIPIDGEMVARLCHERLSLPDN